MQDPDKSVNDGKQYPENDLDTAAETEPIPEKQDQHQEPPATVPPTPEDQKYIEKISKMKKALGLDRIVQMIEDQQGQINQLIESNNRVVQMMAGGQPGNTDPNPNEKLKALNDWNSLNSEQKTASAMGFVSTMADAYSKVMLARNSGKVQQGQFDFGKFSVDFVSKMLSTQMDALAMNAYQSPLKPPTWFQERQPGKIIPPQPEIKKLQGPFV